MRPLSGGRSPVRPVRIGAQPISPLPLNNPMPPQKNKTSRTRRVMRFDPPTLDEAIFAAQGLADDVAGQTEIAAMLMGLPESEVRVAVLKATAPAARAATRPASSRTSTARPTVIVERRMARTLIR
jgi:hypothetical protein